MEVVCMIVYSLVRVIYKITTFTDKESYWDVQNIFIAKFDTFRNTHQNQMADEYKNLGPATKVETIRDVTNKSYFARDQIVNQPATTTYYNTDGIFPPTQIFFKDVPEPHKAFTGRVEYVKSVIEYLRRPVRTETPIQFPCLVIHALGGYGKTQIARKIASVCSKERKFQHFIWIDSEDDVSVKKCFVEAIKQVGLNSCDESDARNSDVPMHQFYNLLSCRTREKFLFIFDNVEDFDIILKFLPLNHRASNFAVLMTSQRRFTRESYGYVRNQPLDLMLEKEAIQLVEKILGTSTMDCEEDKKLLVERSGRIALVLCVMTSTIKFLRRSKSDYSIKDYLREMRYTPIQYSDEFNELDLTYKRSLQNIVGFAVEKLNAFGGPIEKTAVEIFDRLAYCSSTNWLEEAFVLRYFWDICEKAKKMDMKLPVKLVDDMQIFRLAIEKLSESSLLQICGDELTVHLWVQASRRLDLKRSDDERTVLKKLLSIVPDMSKKDEKNSIIWQHVVDDYPDLVHEFYAKKGTLMKFPIFDVDLLEKIIRTLTQGADFQPFENYSKEIEEIICKQIRYSSLEAVKRTVDLFNYGVRKKSRKFISAAISATNLDVFNWLVNENSCIPEEEHLRRCIHIFEIDFLAKYLQQLKEFNIEVSERNVEGSSSNITAGRIASLGGCISSVLTESDPLRMRLCKPIEKYCGKDLLERILHSEPRNVEVVRDRWPSDFLNLSEISRNILGALKNTEPHIDLDEKRAKYSENNLFECLFICGRTHCHIKEDKYEMSVEEMKELNWNSLHRAAYKNNFTALESIDTTLVESKDNFYRTPLIVAVEAGAFEATAILLKKYSANANAMDIFDNTPLKIAILFCYPSICILLLSYGSKAHWKTKLGTSVHALHEAVRFFESHDGPESEDIVVTLLTSKDCDVCVTDKDGDNVLHLLVRYYYATRYKPNHRVLHLILSTNETLVNVQNNDGLTPLQLANKLRAKFSDNHWHTATLQSFTSEVGKLCNWDSDS